MSGKLKGIPFFFGLLLLGLLALPLDSAAQVERITVEASGSGATKMEALKSAWTEAVRKAVGMYTTAKTEVLNDNLTEEIAAYSKGQVNSYETLSENRENGLWTIAIRANIDKDIMQETIKAAKEQTVKIDGGNLAAQIQSSQDKAEDAKDVVAKSNLWDFTKCLDYNATVVKFNVDGKQEFFIQHVMKMDLKKFQKQSADFEKIIAQMANSKIDVSVDTKSAMNALNTIKEKSYQFNFNSEFLKKYTAFLYVVNGDGGLVAYDNEIKHINIDSRSSTGDFVLSEIENLSQGSLCFLKNASSATCYKLNFPDDIFNLIINNYKLKLFIESGSGLDAQIFEFPINIYYSYPPRQHEPNRYLLAPAFYIQSYNAHGYPVLVAWQKLALTSEELANLTEIKGKYILEPEQKNK